MNEQKRNEIISRWRAGASIRQIARSLGMARNTVSGVLAQIQARRAGDPDDSPSLRRPSRLDPYQPVILELLTRYPDLTAVRLLEELRRAGSPAAIPWSANGSVSSARARSDPRSSASRRVRGPRPRWITPSTTSNSPAKADAA